VPLIKNSENKIPVRRKNENAKRSMQKFKNCILKKLVYINSLIEYQELLQSSSNDKLSKKDLSSSFMQFISSSLCSGDSFVYPPVDFIPFLNRSSLRGGFDDCFLTSAS